MNWLDPGDLVDRELSLVEPHRRWIEDVLQAIAHPMTQALDPAVAGWTEKTLSDFLRSAPNGRDPGDRARKRYPGYHFWMKLAPESAPAVPFAGGLSLRIGDAFELKMYLGHVGYHVFPPARGQHYAERSVRLLLPLARRHGMEQLWITVSPENTASRRTCERLGARLIETVDLPADNPLYQRGETRKCRYLLRL
jgi:tagatose 1,6-diphosphate aldolase